MAAGRVYRFGVFELDVDASELRRAGERVAIQPKPLALLTLLLEERARVVPADELIQALWPDAVVSPGSLNRAVSHARRALDDSGRGELIRSVSRRGYRFMGEVIAVGREGEAGSAPVAPVAPPVGRATERGAGAGPAVSSSAYRAGDARSRCVGRREPLARMREAVSSVAAGKSSVVLLSGPAGIGKTLLAEVLAEECSRQGFTVLWGRCRDRDGAPAFWSWAQVLRQLVAEESLRSVIGELAASGELAGLIPSFKAYTPQLLEVYNIHDAPEGEAGSEWEKHQRRFLFFDACGRALRACAKRRPLALFVEDLQGAAAPSLHLLEHLVHELETVPVLVVGTVRDEPREPGDPVSHTLASLRQQPRCHSVALGGLSRGEVAELFAQVIGRPAPVDLTSELYARTEGIPFFVVEAIHLLEERGDLEHPERIPRDGILLPPHSVDLIRQVVDGLSPSCRTLLEAGSVLGREFALIDVAAVADVVRSEAMDRLDEAVRAGIVIAGDHRAAGYRFVHSLYQEAMYEALSPGARARLHRRTAQRLEQKHATSLGPVLSDLAYHHHRSLVVGDPERAFELAQRAAEQAERLYAFEQAARHYEQAAVALDHFESVDPKTRLTTLLALGEAYRQAGDRERRLAVFEQALAIARDLSDTDAFARAAIGYCEISEWSAQNPSALAVIREALALEPPEESTTEPSVDSGVRSARLNTRLAYLSVLDRPAAEPVGRKAVRLARSSGDPEALQEALYVLHYTLSGPDHLDERAEMIGELAEASERCANRDVGVIALIDIASDCLVRGDLAGAQRYRLRADELAGRYASPSIVWHTRVWDAGLALLQGRFSEVEQKARDALLVGRRIGHPFARACFHSQMMFLERELGELESLRARLGRPMSGGVGAELWTRPIVARAERALGDEEAARIVLDEVAERGFSTIPRSFRWHGTMVEFSMLAAELGAAEHAKALIELIRPFRDHHGVLRVIVNYSAPFTECLGALHAMLGMADEAKEDYADALLAASRMGARPAVARLGVELAGLHARSGEPEPARRLLRQSAEIASELGMTRLGQRAQRALERASG